MNVPYDVESHVPSLQSRAASWVAYDWAVWGISLLSGIALLLALARPGPKQV